LHQNWMREYDPTTGRYLQADPLGLVDGPSVYGYARQNPGRYVDPKGESKKKYFVRRSNGSWQCAGKSQYFRALTQGKDVRIEGGNARGQSRKFAREKWGNKSVRHDPHVRGGFSHYQYKHGGRGHLFFGPRGGTTTKLLGPLGTLLMLNEVLRNPEIMFGEQCPNKDLCS